ncbi:hypothetical protein TSAR_014332 [Trichomalopsis sarcophagae]|uniref:Uncharacterized protein n=1 Tax=Trichomalopsis sarcophagae TaxID=543379 RepID=A0A232EFF4_9HYME|nr:hypothetical protein TSAR_014332 [Trichomalopsis sarcophagae]
MTFGRGHVTCVHTSRVSNYYKKTSRRGQCGGGRGAMTECLPCKPEDLVGSYHVVYKWTFCLQLPVLSTRGNSNI